MPTRVLLVEDDVMISEALSLALADEGFDVECAETGEDGLELLAAGRFDVILLDLMLPGIDGLTVCRSVRDQGALPIIVITARADTQDVIAGLEAGADDYVTKPLVAGELAARIRALLRRTAPPPPTTFNLGDLEIQPDKESVLRHGYPVHLTRTEFRLLIELATAEGRVVTREQLLQRVWGHDYFGDTRLLDVHIRRLRRKVEPDPDNPSLVLTVRGRGYQITPGS
ncbi:response regulator transcription factor [Amycolatopsis keratiniphila]|uniref:DNA-binding response regulator n=1 Tax=Amycolatopsis keratiniphila subsp. keratiniphila TaxID=227715 RepID=A0A1W2LZ34_9PSEU|nr:response regulator transcription factor [Amycolatopsis keratiniphila]OLZ58124.1 DNA-binding response regulator [Amycolatopsis keratiniphila subsp. nogabecina]ONF72170.1 DNA-binding response regulator [Amycolatopsis keratiniphila subsp. keratiniphila]SDU44285.1 DNA-binding response regulator, OmpR family, contains REC and winged-helix (wHTH) domain [Amycolatopsis keratiniphila]